MTKDEINYSETDYPPPPKEGKVSFEEYSDINSYPEGREPSPTYDSTIYQPRVQPDVNELD